MPEITVDQWLAELDRLGVGKGRRDNGYMTQELMELSGHSRHWVLERLVHPGIRAGRVKIGWRTTARIDGRQHDTPVYQFLDDSDVISR